MVNIGTCRLYLIVRIGHVIWYSLPKAALNFMLCLCALLLYFHVTRKMISPSRASLRSWHQLYMYSRVLTLRGWARGGGS